MVDFQAESSLEGSDPDIPPVMVLSFLVDGQRTTKALQIRFPSNDYVFVSSVHLSDSSGGNNGEEDGNKGPLMSL